MSNCYLKFEKKNIDASLREDTLWVYTEDTWRFCRNDWDIITTRNWFHTLRHKYGKFIGLFAKDKS